MLGYSATDIKNDLDKVYGTSALSCPTVLWWLHLFKSGRETTEDDHRRGRPLSALNEKDVDTVRGLIGQDVRYTVEEIAMLSGINSSAVFYNIKATTKTPKCLRHMDIPLTNWWAKTEDATALNNSLEKYEHCDQRGLNKIVTGDEMWIYFF